MIVGEPSLMGRDMDDEDERYISRLENSQFEPNVQYQYQQNPNLQSLLHHKQQFLPNSSQLLNPNQMKREQISFPGSPQQLPSMFSNNSLTTNGTNTISNVLLSTSINGELSTTGKRFSNSPQTPSNINQNSSTPVLSTTNAPSTPSWNGSTTNSSSLTTNPGIAEKKQEPHTPPVTPQQTVVTAS